MNVSRKEIALLNAGIVLNLLFSFYFHDLKIAPFSLIAAIILSGFGLKSFRNISHEKVLSPHLVFFLCIYLAISLIWSVISSRQPNIYFYFQSFAGFILSIGAFIGMLSFASSPQLKQSAFNAVRTMFFISLFLFYLQAASWYIYGYELDYLATITGEEQRLIGHTMEIGSISTKRISGLFSEPGLYCWVMIGLGHFLFEKSSAQEAWSSQDLIYILYLLSIVNSFSFFGWGMIFISELIRSLKNASPKSLLMFMITFGGIFAALYPFIVGYWENRILLLQDDGSYNDKLEAFNVLSYYFSDIYYLLLGIGIATKIETPSLGFAQSTLLALGGLGSITLLLFIIHTSFKTPGRLTSKIFVVYYIVFTGYYLSSTITWFIFGAMLFLMSYKRTESAYG